MTEKRKGFLFLIIFLLVNSFGISENLKDENYFVLKKDEQNLQESKKDSKKEVLENDPKIELDRDILNKEKKLENKKEITSQENKRIGLVLSGGTAKGLAHIGILKVLEEEKVPIEYATGTSMGSIIAGMYSVGYTPQEIEEIAISMDWLGLFSDKIERKDKGAIRNSIEDRNSTVIPMKNFMPKLPSGVVGGKTASQRLNEIFYGALRVQDFRKFPRKFAAVATDLESGEGVMIDKGSIATTSLIRILP